MPHFNWTFATGDDIKDIVDLAVSNFRNEVDQYFPVNEVTASRNMTFAIVNQFYLPMLELVAVARDDNGKLMAYTWAKSRDYTPWSDEEMVSIRMAHVDLTLSPRVRVGLVKDMLEIWERFANTVGAPIICSSTMRGDQQAFLKLHERAGYVVHGSFAYKRMNPL